MVTRGSYCLCIKVWKDSKIIVGSLGVITFPKGRYVYVGSALNSLIPRLMRHIKTSRGEGRVAHWHIDYILREPDVEVESIYATNRSVRMECEIATHIALSGEAVPRFGCSDCACRSHLYRVGSFGFIREIGLKKVDLSTLAYSTSPQLGG
jgi:Uri superfamily endonuclease